MSGIIELDALLQCLSPDLQAGEYVFCTSGETVADLRKFNPVATVREKEGITLVVSRQTADQYQLKYNGIIRQITLNVHSSLNAVGLTAAVATKLASRGITPGSTPSLYRSIAGTYPRPVSTESSTLNGTSSVIVAMTRSRLMTSI